MILKRVWDVRMLIGGVVDVFSVVATTFDEACKEAKKSIDENFVKKDGFIESIDWAGKTVLVEDVPSITHIKVSHMIDGDNECKMYDENHNYKDYVHESILADMIDGMKHSGLVKFAEHSRGSQKIIVGDLLVVERAGKEPLAEDVLINTDRMAVFRCFRQGEYAGGVILVAAHSIKEAFEVFANDHNVSYMVYRNEDNELVSDNYPISGWEMVPDLYINASKPHLILENSYAE